MGRCSRRCGRGGAFALPVNSGRHRLCAKQPCCRALSQRPAPTWPLLLGPNVTGMGKSSPWSGQRGLCPVPSSASYAGASSLARRWRITGGGAIPEPKGLATFNFAAKVVEQKPQVLFVCAGSKLGVCLGFSSALPSLTVRWGCAVRGSRMKRPCYFI